MDWMGCLRVSAVVLAVIGLCFGGAPLDATAATPSSGESAESETAAKIDVNTAGSTELQSISGIGPALAARIIEFRRKNGPFERIEQLLAVKGIGPKLLTRMRERVVVQPTGGDGQ